MLSPDQAHQFFALFAKLPTDAFSSVACLYECLHYISTQIAPAVTWKFEYLITGFLLINPTARVLHTYCVKMLIMNFRCLILQENRTGKNILIKQEDYLSELGE